MAGPNVVFNGLVSIVKKFLLTSGNDVSCPLFVCALIKISLIITSNYIFGGCVSESVSEGVREAGGQILIGNLVSPTISLICTALLNVTNFVLL